MVIRHPAIGRVYGEIGWLLVHPGIGRVYGEIGWLLGILSLVECMVR